MLSPVTIVASVKVRDGLILGTDSMTQISVPTPEGQPIWLKSYANARKLFQVGDRPVGVMTYGLGNIGQRSIEGLVLDFSRNAGPGTVEEIASGLFAHVTEHYAQVLGDVPAENQPLIGFYIAGYSSDVAPFPEEFEFVLPRDDAPFPARGAEEFGAGWRGVDAPFTRLYKGFDPYVLPARLTEHGLTQEELENVLRPEDLEGQVIFDGMPLQDGINFAVYILETTIGWSTFQLFAPACGGPLQVATISADNGFDWIAKPALSVQA